MVRFAAIDSVGGMLPARHLDVMFIFIAIHSWDRLDVVIRGAVASAVITVDAAVAVRRCRCCRDHL